LPQDPGELIWATVKVRTALEEMTVAAAAAVEDARSMVEMLDVALTVLEEAARASADRSPCGARLHHIGLLSPRELEVLALVAEGRSNKAIAEALFVSPNTIKTHIASVMNKLDADTRAQLAAIATRHGVHPNTASTLNDIETLAS
jgi:DNA-binding NarL/FixJ family response regulator